MFGLAEPADRSAISHGVRAWLITNPASGSVSDDHPIDALAADAGIDIVARTTFPREALPDAVMLTDHGVELLILFAGDGTINAAACALDHWGGLVLILPGGTMNMLARGLHGAADIASILDRAGGVDGHQDAVALPYVEADPHRAFVAMIAGPPSTWAHAREAVRNGRLSAAWRAMRLAWARSFAGGVRLRGMKQDRRHRAVVVVPDDRGMEVAAIDIERWLDVARLGFDWIAGDWRGSPRVTLSRPEHVEIGGGRSIHLLFDGESVKLPAPVRVTHAMSRLRFIRTIDPLTPDGAPLP